MQELEGCLPAQAAVETELEAKGHPSYRAVSGHADRRKPHYFFAPLLVLRHLRRHRQAGGFTEKNMSVRLTCTRRKPKEYLIKREATL